jgi:hypothetical protein
VIGAMVEITDPGWFRAPSLSEVQAVQILRNDVIHLDFEYL